jgi:hypothetical protein
MCRLWLQCSLVHAVSRFLSLDLVMECCSSVSSTECEQDLEIVCATVAADTTTVRRKVGVHYIIIQRKEKGDFHHLVTEREKHKNVI